MQALLTLSGAAVDEERTAPALEERTPDGQIAEAMMGVEAS